MTPNPPLLSIVSVTFNNKDGLKRTGQSIATQNWRNYEWIVVDGGSADGSLDIIQSRELKPHIIISEPDKGIYDAMNKGLGLATGQYITFLNAGDQLAGNEVLAQISEALIQNPDFIYGDALESDTGRIHNKSARSHLKSALGMFTHHQAMIYRRALIGNMRFDLRYAIAADYDFTLRYLDCCRIVIQAPFPVCIFESGGASQQNRHQGRLEQFRIRRALGTCGAVMNIAIMTGQIINAVLRDTMPWIYWRLRS